jgi:hypothetical protein
LGNWSQAKVSRIENGVVRSTVEDIEAMLDALGVHGDKREQLLALAEEASESTVSWRVLHKGGMARWQYELDQLLRTAARVRHFQPMIVPGLMQTAEYARQALELGNWTGQKDVDAAVVARLARQQILFEPACPQYHYLLGEIGLRWRPSDSRPARPHRHGLGVASSHHAGPARRQPHGRTRPARLPHLRLHR